MTSIDQYFASRQNLWGEVSSSGRQSFAVSEIWHSRCASQVSRTVHREIKNEDTSAWISEPSSRTALETTATDSDVESICVFRVVWVPHNRVRGINDVGHRTLEELAQAFDQQLAQMRYRATFAGAGSVLEPSSGSCAYYICNHPHLAITWSRSPTSGVINVICTAQQRKIDILRDLVSCQFVQNLAGIESTPGLLCSILLCREADAILNNVKHQIRQTETRTGHHGFASRHEMPAAGDLLKLLADMSGCLSNLAVLTRRIGVSDELDRFTMEGVTKLEETTDTRSTDNASAIKQTVSILGKVRQHVNMQRYDTEFIMCRAQTQHVAVLHLNTEYNTLANQELAKDARCLATIAQKDSASIKVLTLVATFFIPPTFVSSLFSTPLFDSGTNEGTTGASQVSDGGKSSLETTPLAHRVLLYLGVTGPLMLITFAVCGLTFYLQKAKHNREHKGPPLTPYPTQSWNSEVHTLVAKRTSSASGDTEPVFSGP